MERHVLTLDETTCRRRTSVKWRAHGEDVLPMWVAEMDVLPAPSVAEEMERITRDGDFGYPVPADYLESVARWYRDAGAPADPGRMRLVPDVMTGVQAAIAALTDPGDPVYVTVPVYPPFHSVVRAAGRQLVAVPLTPTGRLDVPALSRHFAGDPGRGAVLLSNPHNPTGTVPTATELASLAETARTHGVGIISDEVHAPLVLPGASFTSITAIPAAERALAVLSAAKGWNLAGLKAAAVLAGPGSAGSLTGVPEDLGHHASHVAMRVQSAALDDGRDWLADLVADLDANRSLLQELLADLPSALWSPGEATYLAWLDLRGTGLGEDPAAALLGRGRLALNSGLPFGAGEGFARLNFAASPEVLQEGVRRLASVAGA
ncbi:MalY/PatB family protein [Janibacter corallicola]|uniref:MalY/PatB family protein n=1 Tax=Janibacter corallicola TaxID=415212 RepID=UPI00082E5CC8|nr:aminotransferase class I/II-fold pyridoxal phosphate-dependent enzyme [Janibacter corallicola]